MSTALNTTGFKVEARVGAHKHVVAVGPVTTVRDVWELLDTDVKDLPRVTPIVKGRVAHWFTHVVPGAIIEFLD